MNEIERSSFDKLKIENARYKKALKEIRGTYLDFSDAYKVADTALSPPPPPPVTLEALLTALRNENRVAGKVIDSIRFYSDESGHLYGEEMSKPHLVSFYSFQEALDYLNGIDNNDQ